MLTFKISGRLLFNAAILLGILLVQSSDGQSWATFQNKHVDYPKTPAANSNDYCSLMMQRRNLIQRPCKATNNFINYNAATIQQVCRGKRSGHVTSGRSFPVVICRHRANTKFPNCQYTGRRQRKMITVRCDRYKPVYLGGLV